MRHTLISGTTRGIGRALALHFIAQGDRVLGCGRAAATIEHENYAHVQCDLSTAEGVQGLFRQARGVLGHLDVLINNAGAARMLPLALTPDDTARRIVDLNFMATYRMIHAALRLMRKSECARIVNLTTVAVPLRLEGESLYAATKAAVEMLTRCVAKEVGASGVTCNAVGPTPIRTDLVRNVPSKQLDVLINQQAIRKWAEPADVANVIDFFLRPESRMITGQVVYLGGLG
jgi:3-oxoacyl-[acyl-carrier protein] reductase